MNVTMPLWVRVVSRVPWSVLYGFFAVLTSLLHHVFRWRVSVVRANIAGTSLPPSTFPDVENRFYRYLGELLVEVIKSVSMTPDQMRSRVRLKNIEVVRNELDAGRSVMIVTAHHNNWEWLLHAMALDLGYPLDAAYKPLRGTYGERLMRAIRTRFGGRMVPAKELLGDIVNKRSEVRAICMVADQEPFTAEYKWWTQFLGRPTAFFMGPEKISRSARFPVIFAGMRRISRGQYEVTFTLISEAREQLPSGTVSERYARLVEAEVLANPGEWMWAHRRWRLKKDVESGQSATPYISR